MDKKPHITIAIPHVIGISFSKFEVVVPSTGELIQGNTVEELIEILKQCPPDYEVDLCDPY